LTIQGLNPAGARNVSVLDNYQTSYGAHPASYSVGTRVLSQGVTGPAHEVDHLHLLKIEWRYMVWTEAALLSTLLKSTRSVISFIF
jgi:hypothetical protein